MLPYSTESGRPSKLPSGSSPSNRGANIICASILPVKAQHMTRTEASERRVQLFPRQEVNICKQKWNLCRLPQIYPSSLKCSTQSPLHLKSMFPPTPSIPQEKPLSVTALDSRSGILQSSTMGLCILENNKENCQAICSLVVFPSPPSTLTD